MRLSKLLTELPNVKHNILLRKNSCLLLLLTLVSIMIGESVAQKLKAVLLSNNIICRKTDKISDDINNQLVAKMRGNEFSLPLDEATTSTSDKDAYLACYVRFIDNDDNSVEDLLFCKLILTNCKAHKLFAILNNFFLENNFEWKYCVGLCTDGARAYIWSFWRAANVSAGRCCLCKMDPLLNTP